MLINLIIIIIVRKIQKAKNQKKIKINNEDIKAQENEKMKNKINIKKIMK